MTKLQGVDVKYNSVLYHYQKSLAMAGGLGCFFDNYFSPWPLELEFFICLIYLPAMLVQLKVYKM